MPVLQEGHEARQGALLLRALVAITDRAEPGLILTKRSTALRKHAGQIAFPGGRVETSDRDPVHTALRESEEEIGLDPGAVTVLGHMDTYLTGTGYAVVPVVASRMGPSHPLASA